MQSFHTTFFRHWHDMGLLVPASQRQDTTAWPAALGQLYDMLSAHFVPHEGDDLLAEQLLPRVSLLTARVT